MQFMRSNKETHTYRHHCSQVPLLNLIRPWGIAVTNEYTYNDNNDDE